MTENAPYGPTGDDEPFWDAAAEGRLSFQQCADCAYVRWPASGVCPECLSRSFDWQDFGTSGTVWSHVVYHRAYSRSFAEVIPYRVVLAQLDCGPRILARVADVSTTVEVGNRLAIGFDDLGGGRRIPVANPIVDGDG